MEVPSRLTFTGKEVDISIVEKLLNCAPTYYPGNQAIKPVSKRQTLDITIASDVAGAVENPSDLWLTIEFSNKSSFALSVLDKAILQNGSYLNDKLLKNFYENSSRM